MDKYGTDIACLSETKKKGQAYKNIDDYMHIWSGGEKSYRAKTGDNGKSIKEDRLELNDSVTLGDNSVLKVTGKGRVEVRNLIKNQWTYAVINEVFCIPELKRNLLSESVFTGKGKQQKSSSKSCEKRETKAGGLIHCDVGGPLPQPSVSRFYYFLLMKDDYSHFRLVRFLRHKSDVIDELNDFIQLCEYQGNNKKVYTLISNCELEFCNKEVNELLKNKGIDHNTNAPYTQEQNARVEREMRAVMESARTMLFDRKLPSYLKVDTTPYELWTGRKPSLRHTKIFGSPAFALIPSQLRNKLAEKKTECVKQETPNVEPTEKEGNEAEIVQPVEKQVLEENVLNEEEEDDNNYEVVRKRRVSKMPAKYKYPRSFKEAVQSGWKDSIEAELKAHEENETWEIVDRPDGFEVIDSK
ncbi:hypothetical protein ILUMI_13098 [Ignelater luminosus]|uniref:Integrase catalytic domain-containing protein n=1 Tax=Ignelater luminosus TaxID=2038154 RepID=A0A8K0CSZ1_IGNLU|nr:hypothetical protein ILUMI_13098 [Ignelater luminosus]